MCLLNDVLIVLTNIAVMATDRAGVGHGEEARKLGRASLALSVAGIVTGVAAITIITAVTATSNNYKYNNGYNSYNNYGS